MLSNLIIRKWHEHSDIDDLRVRWDLLKFEIQTNSMQISKYKARARRQKETNILRQIEMLDEKITSESASEEELNQYETLKQDYETLQEYKAKGSYIRSRIQNIEEDEKSKYFYNQAKISYDNKSVTKLNTAHNVITTDPKQILLEIKSFYSKLYESSNPNLNDSKLKILMN